jgi:hypothetical protein
VHKAARDTLIAECTAGSSDSYFDVYAQEVNAAVVTLLSKNPLPRLRVRLNLAVMIEAIAHIANTDKVEPAVIKLINDPADVVALWGMKAAKPVIRAVLSNPTPNANDPLIQAILPAVKQHAKAGYVAAEAYPALIPDSLDGVTVITLGTIFNPIMDVLKYRVSLYLAGVPDMPEAETAVIRFLSNSTIRAISNAQQMQDIVQTLLNLLSVAGQQSQAAAKGDLEQINKTLKYVAQSLSIIAGQNVNLNLVMGISPSMPGAQVYQRTKTVYDLLKPVFPYLQPPPSATPATAPATTAAN